MAIPFQLWLVCYVCTENIKLMEANLDTNNMRVILWDLPLYAAKCDIFIHNYHTLQISVCLHVHSKTTLKKVIHSPILLFENCIPFWPSSVSLKVTTVRDDTGHESTSTSAGISVQQFHRLIDLLSTYRLNRIIVNTIIVIIGFSTWSTCYHVYEYILQITCQTGIHLDWC